MLAQLTQLTPPEGVQGHLWFVAFVAAAAGSGVTSALLSVAGRQPASTLTRIFATLTALFGAAAAIVAAGAIPGVPASDYGPSVDLVVALAAGSVALLGIVMAWFAAEPRVAALVCAAGALTSTGLVLYLLLLTNAGDAAAAAGWERMRLSVYATWTGMLAALTALLGAVVSLRPVHLSRIAHGVAFVVGVAAVFAGLSLSGGAALKQVAVILVLVSGFLAWLGWLAVRARAPRPDQPVRLLEALGATRVAARLARLAGRIRRAPGRPSAAIVASGLVLLLGVVALVFAAGGSAREAARVRVAGLEFTPALLVPFAFAPALGLVLGCRALRGRTLWALLLTLAVVGLLVAQKEVGYTGVVLATAAAAFLVARGTWLHVAAAGGLGAVAVGLAFELQPVLPWIPFTVRERIAMWLGSAGLARRGGHLLIADRVTYDIGGVWGVGIDTHLGFEPARLVNSLDTDFPLAAVGLFGGLPWLLAYLALFLGFGLILVDIARRDARSASSSAPWRVPVMVGLAAVPIGSTIINASGGLTHLTPFAGVPAAFLSYGSFFLGGTLAIIALFVIVGSERALADRLQQRARARHGPVELPGADPRALQRFRDDPPERWWRHPSLHGVRLFLRRLFGRLRLATVDAGALLVMAALVGVGVLWARNLHARYTDRPTVYTHPALDASVRIQPLAPGTWVVPPDEDLPDGWEGTLDERRSYRLGAFEMRFRGGSVQVTGACFPYSQVGTRGVRIGFEGLMTKRLGGFALASEALASRLGAPLQPGNDLVLPMAPVWTHHLTLTREGEGRYRVEAGVPGARFVVFDDQGHQMGPPRGGTTWVGAGWTVALADDPRLHLTLTEISSPGSRYSGELCLRSQRRPMFSWRLDRARDTLIGGPDLLRRAPNPVSVDFEFAEDLKRAAEARLLGATADGRLWVTPWDPASRARWDPLTRQRFFAVFRVRGEGDDETLHWVRHFYTDGSTRVRFDGGLDEFAAGWSGELLGLEDPFRFSRVLPSTPHREVRREPGRLLGADGSPLAIYEPDEQRFDIRVPDAGALIGWGFADQGLYGGLVRVFRRLLMGRPVRTRDADDELRERILQRDVDLIGVDVLTTLDPDIQEGIQAVVAEEALAMERMSLERGDERWRPRGRILVLGPENEIVAAASWPRFDGNSRLQVLEAAKAQREHPVTAPGLDSLHRTTTVGSTAKVGLLVAASRHPTDNFAEYGAHDLCIRADGDDPNESRGCFRERGVLSSFRGESIAPLHNYGGAYFGGITTIRQLIRRSINTASAYLAGRIGLKGFQDFYGLIGATDDADLLPPVLGEDPGFALDIERWPGDPLTAWPARLGQLPPGDTWRTSYDVRLGISGFSDFSLLHVGLATAIVARDGVHYPPYLVRGLRDLADGRRLSYTPPHPLQVIPTRVARHLAEAMVETTRYGTAASLKRFIGDRDVWMQVGAKTGTAETVRLRPGVTEEQAARRRKPPTQDHKFLTGFWPASSRRPFVVVTAFEHVSHLDTRVALRMFARTIEILAAVEGRRTR